MINDSKLRRTQGGGWDPQENFLCTPLHPILANDLTGKLNLVKFFYLIMKKNYIITCPNKAKYIPGLPSDPSYLANSA